MAPTGACVRARATPPLSPLSFSHGKKLRAGTAGAVAGIAPGPRAPDQRSRAAQISSRVYAALVGRPADVLPPATAPCFCAAAALSCSILLPLAHCHRRPSSLQSGIKPPGRAWERSSVAKAGRNTRAPSIVVRLRVKPALDPDEKHRRGLQFRVLRTVAVSSTEEVARDDATHVMHPMLATGGR